MTTTRTSKARRFTPVELGSGKVVTAVKNEFGVLEYEALLAGQLIGYYERFSAAEFALGTAAANQAALVPATHDDAVIAALAAFEVEHRTYEATARQTGLADEAKHWLRGANAYAKAREQYAAGVRPEPLAHRAYVLPSQRTGGDSHLLRFDGDWVCSCKSGAAIHWASAMLHGVERAAETLVADEDDEPGEDCPDHGPHAEDDCPKCRAEIEADLGARIAKARRLAQVAI